MRQIVLDTETTGLSPEDGHRIIEIGCVEIINRRLTRQHFHVYLNPDRAIDADAEKVHGISSAFLADKPRFKDVVDEFLQFVQGAELIIHNATFDTGFLNHELRRLNAGYRGLDHYCSILDTLALARKRHPGQRNNLDALCKRYGIDNSQRELHGALLDAEILADVYLAMTGGQMALLQEDDSSTESAADAAHNAVAPHLKQRPALKVVHCTADEEALHLQRLAALQKSSGGRCLWPLLDAPLASA